MITNILKMSLYMKNNNKRNDEKYEDLKQLIFF